MTNLPSTFNYLDTRSTLSGSSITTIYIPASVFDAFTDDNQYNAIDNLSFGDSNQITTTIAGKQVTIIKTTIYLLLDASEYWNIKSDNGKSYIKMNLSDTTHYGNGAIGVKKLNDIYMTRGWTNFFQQDSNNYRWSEIINENRFNFGNFQTEYNQFRFEYSDSGNQLKIYLIDNSNLNLGDYIFYFQTANSTIVESTIQTEQINN